MKRILAVLVAGILLLSAAGCNKTPPDVPDNTDKDKENKSVEEQLLSYDSYDVFEDEIYLCDDVYRGEDTLTHGTGSIALPMGQDVLEVKHYDMLLCGDGCSPESVVSRASQGYAPVYHVVPDGEIDGNFKVLKFKMEIPEPMLEDINKQGVYDQITERLESQYYYLLVLDEKHYAYIHLERIEGAEKLDHEAELADAIVKNARINFEPDNEKINLTIERVMRLVENKGEALTWSDFEMYNGRDIGSGLYIMNYEIDETFDLMVGGVPGTEPMYIRLVTKADRDNYIDIRTEDVEKFFYENREEKSLSEMPDTSEKITVQLPEDFVFPITDGSTSTTNLDKAVRNAILGGEQAVAHTKTYTSFQNLLNGKCELIFTTPLSDSQLQTMQERNFRHEAEPVAGEGFVFVVNKDNPVDTLTIEQIKGIYSGEITNWKEVGGNDADIIAYQRNADSGSQNYMISFMGDTPLMKPVTDQIPASMSGILDVIANYDNGIDAIGYSVYAYSDGMYENISEIKYIKVNGLEPSLTTLADGSYPLLGYNYAVFSADEPEDSNVRTLVKWIQSDEGQQVIADAGFIPYRRVEGLTLPESTTKMLYTAVGTSGVMKPAEMADYYFECNYVPKSFAAEGLNEAIAAFIADAEAELAAIDKEEMKSFVKSRFQWGFASEDVVIRKTLINGYLSVVVGLRYNEGAQDSPDYYYDARSAVFDIYTGKRLELSDLFFEGLDFTAILNQHLANEAVASYSSMSHITHAMLHDFTGLYEGEFTFTADSIIFKRNTCFADGVVLSLDGMLEHMVPSVPRDMAGYADADTPVYRKIRSHYSGDIGYAEEKNGITIWYLDKEKAPISSEVCDRVNGFIDNLYENHFTEEKLLAAAQEINTEFDKVSIGPWPDFEIGLCGNRYIEFSGANTAFPQKTNESCDITFNVIDGQYNPYYFHYYFNAHTGEELRIGDLFKEGWKNAAKYSVYDENFNPWESSTWTAYTAALDVNACSILSISNYVNAPYNKGDLTDLEKPVTVYIAAVNGDIVAVSVPREFIRFGENTGAAELAVPVLSSEIHTNITDPAALTVLCEIYAAVTATGVVSVYFTDAEEEYWFGIGEETRYHTASTVKPVYAQYLLSSDVDMETEITLQTVSRTSSTGKLTWKAIGNTFTVGELIEYSIRYSDNQAHRLLYETFGIEGYNRYVTNFGSGGLPMDEEYEWSRVTPKKLSLAILEIYRYSETDDTLLEHLKNTDYNKQIPAGTKYETAHKYGSNGGADGYHDTAIVFAPGRAYVLTVMTNIDTAQTEDEDAVFRQVAELCDELHTVLFK